MNSRRYRGNWLLTLPLAAIGIGYLYFFFLPAKAEIARRQAELEKCKTDIARARPLTIAVFKNQQELEQTESFVQDYLQRYDHDAASVLAKISQRVQEAGLQTVRFDPQPSSRLQVVKQTPLHLGTVGRFEEVFRMLQSLEAMPAALWIERLSIRAPVKPGELLESEADLVIFAVNQKNSD